MSFSLELLHMEFTNYWGQSATSHMTESILILWLIQKYASSFLFLDWGICVAIFLRACLPLILEIS